MQQSCSNLKEANMANETDVYYELHIQPLFRPTDRIHMLGIFDLWQYEDVSDPDNFEDIMSRLQLPPTDIGLMPPLNVGGPWPQEWIDLLNRWAGTGFKRLAKGAGTYTASWSPASKKITLIATGQVPAPNFAVWLDLTLDRNDPYECVLYQKPGGRFNTTFQTDMKFIDPDGSITTVVVHDQNGRQTVPVTHPSS
jgi:hypothetical protein